MRRFETIRKKFERLEKRSVQSSQKLTIEHQGIHELWIWGGKTVVKILRGVSYDDL